jgi:hypothetical protein
MDPYDSRGKDVTVAPGPDIDWQRLWFATRERQWTSLAIIPSDSGIDAGRVAASLVETGRIHGERPVSLLSGIGVQLGGVHQIVDSITAMMGRGDWVVVPVDPITENPSAVPIVQAASAALLVLRLGESLLGSARATIEVIGRERFLGSVVLGEGGRQLVRPAP